MSANPILDTLQRDAVLEIQKDALWSLDMLAYHLNSDTITVDVATASLYDAYGIMMAAASGIAVVNESAQ